jgi:molecular chaperone GrpE
MTDERPPADPAVAGPADVAAAAAEPGVEALKAEVAAWRDKALRAAADAENTRRRAEREANDARAYAIQRFAKDLVGAADNLELALQAAPREDQTAAAFILGVEMTEKALQSAFERNGLKKIAPERGAKFDPHVHQAMMEQPAEDVAPGAVVQLMQPGYELFGRVVRPAMVVVAARQPNAAPAPAGGDAPPNPYGQAEEPDSGGAVDTKA